jgi:hypothetical protein
MSDNPLANLGVTCFVCGRIEWVGVYKSGPAGVAEGQEHFKRLGWRQHQRGMICPDCIKQVQPPGQGDMNE